MNVHNNRQKQRCKNVNDYRTNGRNSGETQTGSRAGTTPTETHPAPIAHAIPGGAALNAFAEQAIDGLSRMIERKPWLVVGSAAVVGLVAGLLLKRKK